MGILSELTMDYEDGDEFTIFDFDDEDQHNVEIQVDYEKLTHPL